MKRHVDSWMNDDAQLGGWLDDRWVHTCMIADVHGPHHWKTYIDNATMLQCNHHAALIVMKKCGTKRSVGQN